MLASEEKQLCLVESARDGDLDRFKELLEDESLDPNCQSKIGPALVVACFHGKEKLDHRVTLGWFGTLGFVFSIVRHMLNLLEVDPLIQSSSFLGGECALHAAIASESQPVLELLLDPDVIARLDVNAKNADGRTPIMTAAQRENEAAFQVTKNRFISILCLIC